MLNDDGTITRDVTGTRIRRMSPPDCQACPKHLAGFKKGWRRGNEWKFLRYLACTRLASLPRPGGVDQQDSHELFELVSLAMVEEATRRGQDVDSQVLALQRAFGGR